MSSRWRVAASSVVGTSHAKTGAPCQDSHLVRVVTVGSEEFLIGVVSDGAGSAERSEEGSSLACETFASCIGLHLLKSGAIADIDEAKVREWLATAREAIEATAKRAERPTRDYACTILCAVIGPRQSVFFQIGDGAIVVSVAGEQDEWCWVFWPQHGEFANTTNFMTDDGAPDRLEFTAQTGEVTELVLFTDGLENLVLQKSDRSVFAPWFNQMLPSVRALKRAGLDQDLSEKLGTYLSSEAVCNRTDDDKTLILATRRQQGM